MTDVVKDQVLGRMSTLNYFIACQYSGKFYELMYFDFWLVILMKNNN